MGVTKDCFKLRTVNDGAVLKQLGSLNASKAVGLDNIPARFLKDGVSSICPCVTHMVNVYICTSTVPADYKCAKVVPLYKKLEVGNYWPVSIFASFPKY